MKPKGIIWMLTARCNLRCKHCYSTMYEKERELDTATVLRILSEAAKVGVEFVNITGGEPLLRKDLLTILREGRELGLGISIFSNLSLMNELWADELYRLEIPVYTSMDGPEREVHERLRGPKSWDPFLRGLKLLLEKGVDVHVNIAISRENWAYTARTVEKAYDLGVESVSVIPVMKAGRAKETGTYVSMKEFNKALKGLAEEGLEVSVWCAPFAPLVDRSYHSYSCKDWGVMDISPSGRFVLCDVINYEIAKVTERGILGAWEAMYEDDIYKKFMGTPKECLGCPISSSCKGGCYARTWPELKRDPLCGAFLHKQEEAT